MLNARSSPKNPWGSTKDGDLWKLFHRFTIERGWESVKLTKVKGHAKEDQVRSGQILLKDKEGNDKADEAAKDAISHHGEGIVKAANWYTGRHILYTRLIKDIHTHLIEGTILRKKLLQENQAKETNKIWIFREDERKTKWANYQQVAPPDPSKFVWQKLQLARTPSVTKKRKAKVSPSLSEVGKFLQEIELREPQENEFGCTWLEMFLLFRKLGHKNPVPEGRAARAKPSAKKLIQLFKKQVRFFARNFLPDEGQKILLKAGGKKGYALKRLGILNHFAQVNCLIKLPEEARKELDYEILIVNGNKKKNLEHGLSERLQVKEGKLLLRNKSAWARRLRAFESEVLEKFTVEKSPAQTDLSWLAASVLPDEEVEPAGGVTKKCRVSPVPCPHDFVQPVVVPRGRKRACTEAPLKGQPVLRMSMLSAKLKERFAHLCADG